jgi:2-polyprenyl-3-methyl-5-hydroxy-6-metoxy-1,4-benzoquinol methylase
MAKDIRDLIENDLELDGSGVWVISDKKAFPYSEGPSSEKYLDTVFRSASDFSSNSYELERWIKDWPSEYHLSRKRSQLLRGFRFDPSLKVLEVGCGCGAITRFLGETFNQVVAVEGSLARARLARLRTKDMDHVSIIRAPFQSLTFKERFDIIFCIGVFEYSNMFVDSPDPFNFILRYFRDNLTPDGVVVIAIENQFGLKYFCSSKEDHTNIMFDGLEGYPRCSKKERTFGYHELRTLLAAHFNRIDFYFPFPDYKTPSCILSERCFHKLNAAELIGRILSSPYMDKSRPLFDERLVLLELEKNKMLPFFSNSFLVAAGADESSMSLDGLGFMFSNGRVERLQTVSRIVEDMDGCVYFDKCPVNGNRVDAGSLTLHKDRSPWINELSIQGLIMRRAKDHDLSFEELFSPCLIWLEKVRSLSTKKGDACTLAGSYIDCIWGNSFLQDAECRFIDREWEWKEEISVNLLVIRSIYELLNIIDSMSDINPRLNINSRKRLIKDIAKCLGVDIRNRDFEDFCKLEARLGNIVYGKSYFRCLIYIRLQLHNKCIFSLFTSLSALLRILSSKIRNVVMKFA